MNKSKGFRFQKERTNTDVCLRLEREKTNLSILQAKEEAESQTDKIVREDRNHTDQSIANARSTADAFREDRGTDKDDEKHRRHEARRFADAAIRLERSRVDTAMSQEREMINTIGAALLFRERQQTDKSLVEERTITDLAILASSSQLSKEVGEHIKTKASLTTRDEFLAIVSHDLRNPIGTISSCMEMLIEEFRERKIDEETLSWIKLAKRNSDSSLRLIRDILDMERIAEGKLKLEITKCDLGKLIKEVMENFVHVAAAGNVLLRSITAPTANIIDCDRDRIAQVLSNLIGNALKYTLEGGRVTVKVEEQLDDDITISISDTGIGIPNEKKDQIFDRFAQLKSKDRRGLGLGLHISKMLVEAHGGKLWVESKLGIGSTFYFKIPKRAPMVSI